MENKKLNEFLDDVLLGKFLVNFFPGLILFYVLTIFIKVNIGEGLISLVIVTSVSWTLGVLLEMVFFRKAFNRRWKGEISASIDRINLLLGKTGISILTAACVFYIDHLFDREDNMNDAIHTVDTMVKFVFFCIGGILLYVFYIRQARKSKE